MVVKGRKWTGQIAELNKPSNDKMRDQEKVVPVPSWPTMGHDGSNRGAHTEKWELKG